MPKVTDKEFEEILEGVTFIQDRDKDTGCRILRVQINRRFIWATNIVVDLDEHPEAKRLLSKKLQENYNAQKSEGSLLKAMGKVASYVADYISQARARWAIEEVFNLLKTGDMKIEKRKSRMYEAEKAYFYIALLAWMILGIYRYHDKYAGKVLKGSWKEISRELMFSIWADDVTEHQESIDRRTCMRVQLIE